MPRADQLMLAQGLAPTRSAAARLIDDQAVEHLGAQGWAPVRKAGQALAEGVSLRLVRDDELRWASRAGLKLEAALRHCGLALNGGCWLDVGQSTGGFTDVLLHAGAQRVVGIDVGHGQLLARLRQDPRVVCLEGVHARELQASGLAAHAPEGGFDGLVADVSFIALSSVLPHLKPWLRAGGQALLLVKPQFEVGREHVGKGGIVRDPSQQARACERVTLAAQGLGWQPRLCWPSAIRGGDGNEEFFLWAQAGEPLAHPLQDAEKRP